MPLNAAVTVVRQADLLLRQDCSQSPLGAACAHRRECGHVRYSGFPWARRPRAQTCTKAGILCPSQVTETAMLSHDDPHSCATFLYVPLPVFEAGIALDAGKATGNKPVIFWKLLCSGSLPAPMLKYFSNFPEIFED